MKTNQYYNCTSQGLSQKLKEVPKNFMQVFNVDGVAANNVIQKNKHR